MTKNLARHLRRHQVDDRQRLADQLAGYTTKAELLELSAILARHSDRDADPVRELVDWTRAA